MNRISVTALLLVTTFFWGVTFTVVKEAVARVDVFVFLGQRFLAAFALLVLLALWRGGRPDALALRGAGAMGLALFLAYAFQTMALRATSASNAAFLTGLSVVLVPVLGAALFRQRVAGVLWLAVLIAAVGLFLITTNGRWVANAGDGLAALCAVCVAFHLLLTGRYAPRADLWWLSAIQIGVVAVLSAGVALARHERLFVWHPLLLGPLAVTVLGATVLAFPVQTAAQRLLSPINTALIFCMEPVFGAAWAAWALGERLGPAGWTGAGLILAAMLLAELTQARSVR